MTYRYRLTYQDLEREVDLKRKCIIRDGQSFYLEPIAWNLLLAFVKRPQTRMTRDELLEEVWGTTAKSDGAFDTALSAVRSGLGDQSPFRWINTKRKLGYELQASVEPIAGIHPAFATAQ